MNEKLLTVIVPSYNMERYLPRCLDSIRGSGVSPELLDVIVVNDGSKDRTSEIAHEYAVSNLGVRVIDKVNGHYGSCINAALKVASGRFVKVLDADDTFESKNLLAYVDFLNDHQDADVVFTDYKNVYADGSVSGAHKWDFPVGDVFSLQEIAAYSRSIFMPGLTYKTENLKRIGYHQLEGVCYTDTEWCFLPMVEVKRAWYCPVVVYCYFMGRQGQSVDEVEVGKNQWMYLAVLRDMVLQYTERESCYTSVQRQYLALRFNQLVSILYLFAIYSEHPTASFLKFDQELRKMSADVYEMASDIVFSKKLRCRYIHWVRRAWIFRGVILWWMRVYSKFVRLFR